MDYLPTVTHLSDSTLSRLLLVQKACACLMAYRDPKTGVVTREERHALARLLWRGESPWDAAEIVQQRT